MKLNQFLAAGTVVVLIPIFSGILFFLNLSPRFDPAPVFMESEKAKPEPVNLSFDIGEKHFLSYEITGDIRQLQINGIAVKAKPGPIDLRQSLPSSHSNGLVTVGKSWKLARFGIRPSMSDEKNIVLLLTVSLITLLASFGLIRIAKPEAHHMQFMLFFVLGSLTRFWYFLATPWWIRSHDAIDHAEYIGYIVNNWAIPDFHHGWQFYQPPAYHIIGAFWSQFIHLLVPLQPILSYEVLQSLSVFVSIFTLFFALLTGLEMFDDTENRSLFKYYCAAFTFFPGLIYLSSQICNDVVTHLFLVAAIWTLMRWWHTSKPGFWWSSLMLSIAGLFSKTNSILILFVVLLLPIINKQLRLRTRVFMLSAGVALCALLTGPLCLERMHQGQKHLVGNVMWNAPGLFSKDDFASYVVFDPIQVTSLVYNRIDNESGRRRFVWEFLFRSALFGENPLGISALWLARSVLVLSLLTLLVALYGFVKEASKRFYLELPMFLILAGGLSSIAIIRLMYHIGLFADFRYCVYVMVPICFFYCRGLASCTGKLQIVLKAFAWLACALTIVLLSYICFKW